MNALPEAIFFHVEVIKNSYNETSYITLFITVLGTSNLLYSLWLFFATLKTILKNLFFYSKADNKTCTKLCYQLVT